MNLIKRINNWAVPFVWTIFEVDKGKILTNGSENKKTNDDA